MFKKNISVSSTHQLSGKDGKELRKSVLKVRAAAQLSCSLLFACAALCCQPPWSSICCHAPPCLHPAMAAISADTCNCPAGALPALPPCPQAFPAVGEEQLAALLPGKSGLVQTKLSNRCVVYSAEGGNPLFFDPDGRGGLLPTVRPTARRNRLRACWEAWGEPLATPCCHRGAAVDRRLAAPTCRPWAAALLDTSPPLDAPLPPASPEQVYALAVLPQLLPQLHTWSEVSGKVLGGADLFLQGVLVPEVGGTQRSEQHRAGWGACRQRWQGAAWRRCHASSAAAGVCKGLLLPAARCPGCAPTFPCAALQGGLPDFLAGSPRSLCVPGNPIPFAGESVRGAAMHAHACCLSS